MSRPCRGCSDPIDWIETPRGRRICLNPDRVTIVTDAGEVVSGRVAHFATCPKANELRDEAAAKRSPPVQQVALFEGSDAPRGGDPS